MVKEKGQIVSIFRPAGEWIYNIIQISYCVDRSKGRKEPKRARGPAFVYKAR